MSGVHLPLKSNPELISVNELCVGLCPRMRALLEFRPAQGNSQVKTALILGALPSLKKRGVKKEANGGDQTRQMKKQ